jgi:diadenosine tetraphosphate (Ap4A) HIT family hydrolase
MNNRIFEGPTLLEDANAPWDDIVEEDFHVIVYRDRYPVTQGHLLFVPKYNTISVLTDAFEDAVRWGKSEVQKGNWDGFNVGINYGKAAGQTVMWPHVHLIPRKSGDVEDPVGGVRNTIPGKGNYRSPNYKHD